MRSFDAMVMGNASLEPTETSNCITFEWVLCIVFTITISPEWIAHGNWNATSVVVRWALACGAGVAHMLLWR